MEPGSSIPLFKEKRPQYTKQLFRKIYAWHQPHFHFTFFGGVNYFSHQVVEEITLRLN